MKEFRGRRTRVSYNSEEELVVHIRFLFSLLSFPFSFSCWDKLNFHVRSYTCNNKFNFAVPGPQPRWMFCKIRLSLSLPLDDSAATTAGARYITTVKVSWLTLVKRDARLQFSAASGFRRFDWTPVFDLDFVGWIARAARRWAHAKFDLSSHCHKSLLYVHRVFRRRFQKWYAELIGIFLFTTKYSYAMRIVRTLHRLHELLGATKSRVRDCLPWPLYNLLLSWYVDHIYCRLAAYWRYHRRNGRFLPTTVLRC